MVDVKLRKSRRVGKKWSVEVLGKTVHFGQEGAEDFTTHSDLKRKENYLARHKKRENWNASGIETAGFWARWFQ